MDLTIVTCNYNTVDLVRNLITSIRKVCKTVPKILVMDTGEIPTPSKDMISGGDYGDIQYFWKKNTTHGNGVNLAMDLVKTRYMLLVDSDVLFLQDIEKPFNIFKDGEFTLMGEVVGDRGGKSLYPRVNPWFCFMDLKQLHEKGIQFYDHYRTKVLKSPKIYDIGSSMYEDVLNNELSVANVLMENKYFRHYEGMSWRVQRYNPNNGDTDVDVGGTHDNKALYEYGLQVMEQYERDVKNL